MDPSWRQPPHSHSPGSLLDGGEPGPHRRPHKAESSLSREIVELTGVLTRGRKARSESSSWSAPWDRSLMVGGRVKGTGHRHDAIFLQPLQPIPPMLSVSFRAQERSRTALFQRRRRLVLDGSEHGRTMIDSGGQTAARSQAARTKAFLITHDPPPRSRLANRRNRECTQGGAPWHATRCSFNEACRT